MIVFAILEYVGNLGVAFTVRARLGKSDFDVVVAVLSDPYLRDTERAFQLTGGAALIFRSLLS